MATGWTYPIKLPGLPLVLAGPILRKVTPGSVTVWFALQKPATDVRLTVSDANGPVLTGSRKSYAIGQNLHIVAVTADKAAPPRSGLVEGVIYTYDVAFDFPGAPNTSMLAAVKTPGAPKGPALSYHPFPLPTFCLPPSDLNKLRIMHGSCRHPNADGEIGDRDGDGGRDAIAILDALIEETASHPDLRPHQFLMTGDQIYADDVAGHLLLMLTQVSDLLLGWQEVLPLPTVVDTEDVKITWPNNGPRPGNKAPPYTRDLPSIIAGFTSDVPYNHLFSLGEYICMYLFVWSEALWPVALMPTEADVRAACKTDPVANERAMNRYIESELRSVEKFRKTLPEVRRALANIPTYMIFDDHDVTDDFNMERGFFQTVYSNDMGKRVVQNGLVAYALCQHWGNVPESFALGSGKPGLKLLEALDGGNAATYAARSADQLGVPGIMRLVGVHDLAAMKAFSATATNRSKGLAVFHDADALTYDYTIEGPSHQVIVTDTRTWRLMPDGRVTPQLLPKDQVERQITNAKPPTTIPATATKPAVDRLLFVVVTTNAPPVKGIRFAGDHGSTSRFLSTQIPTSPPDFHPDVYEAWELPSAPFNRLIKAVSDRLPLVDDHGVKTRRGAAVLLSGDVHHAFSTRLLFNGTSRFEDTTKQPANVVVAQLVASSFRNQVGKSIDLHKSGYNYLSAIVGGTAPEGYMGWNIPVGSSKTVGVGKRVNPKTGHVTTTDIKYKGPTVVSWTKFGFTSDLTVQPDYFYRLDYLVANNRFVNGFGLYKVPPNPPNPTPAQRAASAQKFRDISGNYRAYLKDETATREIVGVNNIGEITVEWHDGDNKRINHTVRWHDENSIIDVDGVAQAKVMITNYGVSLNPADPDFPLNKVVPAVKVAP